MSDVFSEQIGRVQQQVNALKKERVTYRTAQVTATGTDTFTADVEGAGVLDGIPAPPSFLPAVGDTVTLNLIGATPQYQPVRIGEDSVSYTELAPAVTADMLLFQSNATTALAAANGKNKVTYSLLAPSGSGTVAGDPWFQRDGTGVVTGSWEWDGDSWEVRKFGDAVLNSLTAGKITAGTINADVTVAGRFTTALTGQRRELNSVGFQAYNASNTLTVNIDGTTNLLTGVLKTALTGQRIEIGANALSGRIDFFGSDGSTGLIEAYADGAGTESIRLTERLSGTWYAWNGVQFQTNERAWISSGRIDTIFGGSGAGSKEFTVQYATTSGSNHTLPTRSNRLLVANDSIRMWVGAESTDGSVDVVPHGVVDSRLRSPKILFRAEGGSHGSHIKYVVNGDLTSPRLEVTGTDDASFGAIWAAAFTVSSSEVGKTEIADLSTDSAFDQLRAMRVRTWRQPQGNGRHSDVRIGLVAEEAPASVVEGEAQAVNLYSLTGLILAGLQRTIARVLDLGQDVNALKARVAVLEGRRTP